MLSAFTLAMISISEVKRIGKELRINEQIRARAAGAYVAHIRRGNNAINGIDKRRQDENHKQTEHDILDDLTSFYAVAI